jgi:hypothetical protein
VKVLIALLVTVTMAGVDFCHARYTRALLSGRVVHAAIWSVGQWGAATVGFVVALKISVWYLPFEALGLFMGTLLGARRFKQHDNLQRRSQSDVPGV